MKIKVIMDKPYWAKEYELLEARSNLESDCNEARTLYDAILCGANMTHLNGKQVGYVDEDGEFQLYGDYETYTEEQLQAVKVDFYGLDTDADGYTVAYFNKIGE